MSASSSQSFLCSECGFEFTMRKNLYAHLRKVHDFVEDDIPTLRKSKNVDKNLLCSVCGKQFISKSNLARHVGTVHKEPAQDIELSTRSRISCPVSQCSNAKFKSYFFLRKHLKDDHNTDVHYKELSFTSFKDFELWKCKYEYDTVSSYVMKSAPNCLNHKEEKRYYHCHRSYDYKCKGKNMRSIKNLGSNKIGNTCPSVMNVSISEKECVVKFWATHVGHSLDIGRNVISKEDRLEIAGKLSQGVSYQVILDDIRNSATNEDGLQRIHLLEKKDLHNISRDFNISYSTKWHQDDAVSVKLWVSEMRSLNDECPVLYYKEQTKQDEYEILSPNDFVLILMTNFQARQLKKFGHDKICIDGTHGTNEYKFNLYTLVTVDEYGKGCPVAFCFSNRSDETIFTLYFNCIKNHVGPVNANIFMSDDAPEFYNSWCVVMGGVAHRLLCTWHVDKNWRRNLSKITGGIEKKAFVYKSLRVVLQITSVEEFEISLQQLAIDLLSDPDTVAFGKYFESYYMNRPQCWAYCYRVHLGINTNMYLESLHKILKHTYLEGKKVRRLDKTIDAVMKIARDSLFKRLITIAKNIPSEKIQRVRASHSASNLITPDSIEMVVINEEWSVPSQTIPLHYYIVTKVEGDCENCVIRCEECHICVHNYKCTCLDNIIKMNICKHIHACAMIAVNNNTNLNKVQSDEVEDLFNFTASHNLRSDQNNEELVKKAELIIGLCNTVNLTQNEKRHASKALDTVIEVLNKGSCSFKTVLKVNNNQKVEKQVRLFSTKKVNSKQQNIKKPTFSEEKSIKDAFLNSNKKSINVNTTFGH